MLGIKFQQTYSEDSQATVRYHQVNEEACPEHSPARLKAKTRISHKVKMTLLQKPVDLSDSDITMHFPPTTKKKKKEKKLVWNTMKKM